MDLFIFYQVESLKQKINPLSAYYVLFNLTDKSTIFKNMMI